MLVEVLNEVAQYKVEHALPTQQVMVDQNEEHALKDDNFNRNNYKYKNDVANGVEHKRGKRDYIITKLNGLKNKCL